MLAELQVRNFAIIESLDIGFSAGLTVITGETGAGKSILVNAVNLLLGGRGSAELIRGGASEATVCGLFTDSSGAAESLLVRRTLTASGRNRVQINGELATVGLLAERCRGRVNISGQHEHQLYLDPEIQLLLVDKFGGLEQQRQEYTAIYRAVRQAAGELARRQRQAEERRARAELYRFQVEEIRRAQIGEDEELSLAEERQVLRHAERLYQGANETYGVLYGESGAVVEQVGRCQRLLAGLGEVDHRLQPLAEALEEARLHLEDVALGLRDYASKIEVDPARLQWVEERLHLLQRLMAKYGGSSREVLATAASLERELAGLATDEAEIDNQGAHLEELRQRALSAALELSAARRQAARRMAQAMVQGLATLGMAEAQFLIKLESLDTGASESIAVGDKRLDQHGLDRACYLFSANPGEEPRPLAKVASGGELSRIVLALKELLAREQEQETIIFDEVDAGIGGRTADLVGRRLKALSRYHQVLCITHLPQIACYGEHHFVVRKQSAGKRAAVEVREVRGEERLEEIARMLGGAKISARTRAHAAEMLAQAARFQVPGPE